MKYLILSVTLFLGMLSLAGPVTAQEATTDDPYENFTTDMEDVVIKAIDEGFVVDEQHEVDEEEKGVLARMMDHGPTVYFLMVLGVAGTFLWVVMLFDAAHRPGRNFPGNGPIPRKLWVVGLFFTWILGALIYYLLVYTRRTNEGLST